MMISSITADDLFLLSGQSNMDGYTTTGQSLTGNADYWIAMKSILTNGDSNMTDQLYDVIYEANSSRKNGTEEVASTLTNELMHLYNQGLLNDLDTPLKFGKCSFVTPKKNINNGLKQVSGGSVPTSWDSNCGYSFGHEFILSRTLELQMGMNESSTTFEMVKHSRGGTSIYKHWYPGIGEHWQGLQQTIRERTGHGNNWKGLIWHQGSQETNSLKRFGEDRSLTYLGNMTGLIRQLRQEMYAASESGTWQCKEEIPVVVVQLGYWPNQRRQETAQRVRDAQAEYCSNDPKSQLVKSNDLSRNFHYDAASFLVTGNRIAHAYQAALKGEVVCPGDETSQPQQVISSYQPSTSKSTSSQPSSRPSTLTSIVTPTTTIIIHPPGDNDKTTDDEPKLLLPDSASETKRRATIFDGTYRNFGFMLDIRTKKEITIHGIELNLHGNSDYAVEVYTKMGSFKGSESDEEAWELWYNGTVTGAGLDSESCIGKCGAKERTDDDDDDDDGDMRLLLLDLPANETRALYVSFQEAVLVYSSNGDDDENNNSSLDFENDDVELYADGGVKQKGWDGKVVHPRLFNGALTYETKRSGEII